MKNNINITINQLIIQQQTIDYHLDDLRNFRTNGMQYLPGCSGVTNELGVYFDSCNFRLHHCPGVIQLQSIHAGNKTAQIHD